MATSTIPVITIALPAAEDTDDVRVRQVPVIPIDVFLEIVLHLQFNDRLNISLLSRDIYSILPPKHTHVVVSSTHQLASFATYISGDPTRASSLRSVHILIDYPFPYENPFEIQDAQHNACLILENTINLEELVCRSDGTNDLLPEALTTSRRLSHLELQGLPSVLTGKAQRQEFFSLTLRSIHVTRWYPGIVDSLPLARILRLVSHLPSLDTLTVENHRFSLSMLQDDEPPRGLGERSTATPLPFLPSLRTLKLRGRSRGIVHSNFVPQLAHSLPNLTTLHLDRTSLPKGSPEYAIDHLVLTDLPCRLEHNPVPWTVRRLSYELAADRGRSDFVVSHCRVDLRSALCISIRAPVIAPRIWAHLVTNKWDVRLLELESTVTSFVELVAPIVDRRATESPAGVPLTCISISARDLGLPWDSEGTWERARSDFLQGASRCFPSLHYVAVATPNRPAHLAPSPAYPGEDVPVWTWWRVRRDNAGAPVEIPVCEGRRVREFLRDASAEAVDSYRAEAGCRSVGAWWRQ